jgi:transposase-like protein
MRQLAKRPTRALVLLVRWTHGEISAHLAEVYGAEVSKQTISAITDRVMEGMVAWQNRPLDAVYPVIFIDCSSCDH